MKTNKTQEKWTSNLGFILAAAGSAIGLSNIWKFPYTMGQNGGSAFFFCYLVSSIFLALPGMIADTMLGRHGRGLSPIESTRNVLKESGHQLGIFKMYGLIGGFASILMMSYYSVICGWSIDYIIEILRGNLKNVNSPEQSYFVFDEMMKNPYMLFFGTLCVMLPAMWVVGLGIEKGIEKFSTICVGFICLYAMGLFVYSIFQPGFTTALKFMFAPDFSKITLATIVEATGQSFFTVAVGLGHIAIYGAMLDKKENIVKNSVIVAVLNTVFSLFIGVAIFSFVFSKNMSPSQGSSLIFGVFPLIINDLPFPMLMMILFFFMFYIAGITSVFAVLEGATQTLMGFGLKRMSATITAGITTLVLSIAPILGYSLWKDYRLIPYGFWKSLNILDTFDFIVSNFCYPFNSILLFIIIGFMTSKAIKSEELNVDASSKGYILFDVLVKYVAPISVFVVMLSMLGLTKF